MKLVVRNCSASPTCCGSSVNLYFDLPRFTAAGNVVDPVLDWAERYRRSLAADEVSACLVVVGRKVRRQDQRRLMKAGIHFLDESRPSFQRLMGSGDRSQQIYRLIQHLCGFPIAPLAFPDPLSGSAASARATGSPLSPSAPGAAAAGNWDAYPQRPAHIDRKEVETLFGWLTHEPPDWERDS